MADKSELDEYQLQAVEASVNTVVSAGAGSGKTRVLSERFTDLVLNRGCKVDEILTLTFTIKATVEMSSRIYKVLKEKAPDAAKDFYKSNIKTLDSYCSNIAKTGARYFGITPDFTQDEDEIKDKLNASALKFLLENRDNPAIKALVKTKDYARIAEELFVEPVLYYSTVIEPIDYDFYLERQLNEVVEKGNELIDYFDKQVAEFCVNAEEFLNHSNKFYQNFREVTLNFPMPEPEYFSAEKVKAQLKNPSETENLEGIYRFIQAAGKYCSLKNLREKNAEFLKDVIADMREKYEILMGVINFVYGYRYMVELLPLLKAFQEQAGIFKRSAGLLSFKDIAAIALKTLIEYPEIRRIEKKKFKAIMIDEFQDNNSQQRDMLFLLAENEDRMEKSIPKVEELCPDKLFFVGDEKQSIYKFRGADVSVFRALSEDFKGGNLYMSTNYRSHPALIAGFNAIFGGIPYPPGRKFEQSMPSVFYTKKGILNKVPAYEAVYEEVTLSKTAKDTVKTEGKDAVYVPHIHLANFDDTLEVTEMQMANGEAEAEWVARKIRELITTGINGKVYKPQEIAILLRKTTNQILFERKLLSYGIPYAAGTVSGFFDDGVVNDIFAFLKLCIYQDDRLSYAQLLCSPFVNLTKEQCDAILISQKPFWSEEVSEFLDKAAFDRFMDFKNFFLQIREISKNESLSNLITSLWYGFGYRFEAMWNPRVSMYSKMQDLLFDMARKCQQKSMNLSAFVDYLAEFVNQKLKDVDIPVENEEGVQIMTVHKSKGLEFGVVFVCETGGSAKGDSNTKAVYFSPEYGITVNTPACDRFSKKSNYFYEKNRDLNESKESAELRRLVYVALTRAVDELYITNPKYKPSKDCEDYLPGGSKKVHTIFNTLEPVLNAYSAVEGQTLFSVEEIPAFDRNLQEHFEVRENKFSEKIRLINQINQAGLYEKTETVTKDVLSSIYSLPSKLYEEAEENSSSHESSQSHPFMEIDEIISRHQGFSAASFGTIAHAYMEAAIKKTDPRECYSNRDIAALESNETDYQSVQRICLEMQKMFMASELGKTVLQAKWTGSEYPFRLRISAPHLSRDKIIKGVIDLVFQEADGSYTIVDYKSNTSIEPEIYYVQLACYRSAVAEMLGIKNPEEIKCKLYYLRFGETVDVSRECSKIDVSLYIQD